MILLLKNLLFTVLVPGTVAVAIPLWLSRETPIQVGWTALPGGLLLVFGAMVYGWCVWDFATFGRGTPAPVDAPKRLVVRGLYRYARNPMYVGVLSVILGWTVTFADLRLLIYWLLVFTLFHLQVVLYEEPRLRTLFGAQYDRYRATVNRWIPRVAKHVDN